MLCEGTRRQKGELAVAMLVQYKDETAKLARVSVALSLLINYVKLIVIVCNHF